MPVDPDENILTGQVIALMAAVIFIMFPPYILVREGPIFLFGDTPLLYLHLYSAIGGAICGVSLASELRAVGLVAGVVAALGGTALFSYYVPPARESIHTFEILAAIGIGCVPGVAIYRFAKVLGNRYASEKIPNPQPAVTLGDSLVVAPVTGHSSPGATNDCEITTRGSSMIPEVVQKWHLVVETRDSHLLDEILADDARMHSPVVHTVQEGKELTKMYLSAAAETLGNDSFRYVREVYDQGFALLEFETELDGISVNGVDMISWNDDNKITDFKVMIRPLKGIGAVHKLMGEALAKRQP